MYIKRKWFQYLFIFGLKYYESKVAWMDLDWNKRKNERKPEPVKYIYLFILFCIFLQQMQWCSPGYTQVYGVYPLIFQSA